MNSLQNVYPDAPIKPGSQDIRVLQLLPGTCGSPVVGRLVRHDLQGNNDTQSYEALSYRWGTTLTTRTIELNQNLHFKITAALESALQMLRWSQGIRTIWIDAICINQGDIPERNQQVQLMRRIYRNAKSVRVWLDVDVDPSCPAMIKLKTLDDRSTDADLGDDPSFWEPLCVISKDQYWMRVWIQQEISNATSLTIQCRRVLIPILNWYHYIRIASERTEALDFNTPVWLDWLNIRPNLRLPKRFSFLDSVSHPVQGSTLSEDDLDLLAILSMSFKLECTDDRDRLYGILSLARDYSEGDIPINYERSVPEIYTSFAKFMLQKYNSLNFLLYAGISWRDPSRARDVPTWVPDWRNSSTRTWLSNSPQNSPEVPLRMPRLRPAVSSNGAILQTYGMRIDHINQIYHLPEGAELYNTPITEIVQICRSIVRNSASTQQDSEKETFSKDEFDLPQWHALVRVLTGVDLLKREDSNANNILRGIVTASADDFVKASLLSEAKTEDESPLMINVIRPNTPTNPDSGKVFAQLAWGIIGKHQPFVGENGGIGLALSSSQSGDEIWIVRGCNHPMILRSNGDHYLVVGEGSYDGANRGELLREIPDDAKVGTMIGEYEFQSISLG